MDKKNTNIIIMRESFAQSVVSDLTTFGIMIAAIAIDTFYIGGSTFYKVFFAVMFTIYLLGKASNLKNSFHTKKDAIEYIEGLEGE
ncbi:MAG: hypothetical protein DHS20C08_04290 [Rhodomicrobium sp.]|nr:MAG: hypothetical protein DHS20C08_04290 [Rhodomicrobium sp.]